jgi:hypothetical protein
LETFYQIEMAVPTYKRQGMLAAERGNPEVISGDRLA